MSYEILCTRRDFEKARNVLLRFFQENGIATRRQLTAFKAFGVSYEAIELSIRYLRSKGTIEELYTLPGEPGRTGQRVEYLALSTALDTHSVELPVGVVRESKAFELIADLEAV